MKKIIYIISFFLVLFILFICVKYFFIYKDVMFSFNSTKELRGKIVYSSRRHNIKVIDLPSGKCRIIYSNLNDINRNYTFVHSPYFSPDGRKIVFNQSDYPSNEKIYIMNADGSNIELFLDLGKTGALCPSWSPDGKKIAYVVQEEGRQGLYTIRISDGSIDRITNIQPDRSQPAWPPDSKMVAFVSDQQQKRHLKGDLYEIKNLGGTYIINLENGKVEQYIDLASEPALSPDGKMLAYGNLKGFHIIDLKDILSGRHIFIPHFRIPPILEGKVPNRWSPDGKYIVYCQEVWPGIAGIYVTPIDNPKKKIRIGTDHMAIIGMSWAK